MIARILDNHFINLEQLSPAIEEHLIRWFSVRSPRAHFISSGWDGWFRRYNVERRRLALPFLNELIQRCKKANIPLDICDERPAPKYPAPQEDQITETLLDGITLDSYQVRSIRCCCKEEIGLVNVPVGGGKTELMAGLIKSYRCPTVVITEQIVVLEQIVDRLTLRNVVHNNDIGLFCHGYMPDNNLVVVGSIQSLSTPKRPDKEEIFKNFVINDALKTLTNWANKHDERVEEVFEYAPGLAEAIYDNPGGIMALKGRFLQYVTDYFRERDWKIKLSAYKTRLEHATKIQDFVAKCDLLLVDEADLATTSQYAALFKKYFKGRRRYGFTGTVNDKDKPVQTLLLKEHLGNIIAEASRDEVREAGRTVPIRFVMLAVGEDGDKTDGRAYDIAEKEELIENVEFHKLVANVVSSFPDDRTLILIETSPIEPLGYALQELIPGSRFVYGQTPREERKDCVDRFEKGVLKTIIGSKIFKRGLDIKGGVENLIIIGGGAKWSDFDQKIGRAVRVNKRGWARVFGFFHLSNKYLYKHSRENLKAVVSMGYSTKILVNGREIDGKDFIKSQFRLRKTGIE